MTEYADKMIGRVLDALEAHGVRDDTIVFFSGDNGIAVELRQGRKVVSHGKNRLTEAGVNVPFIVSGGPVARRGRTDALTDFTDVLADAGGAGRCLRAGRLRARRPLESPTFCSGGRPIPRAGGSPLPLRSIRRWMGGVG